MGGESATPASTNGYSVITSPAPSAALSPYDQKMYEAMSTDVKKKSMKKQMSQAYPTLSPAQSVKGYSQGPPMYNQHGQPMHYAPMHYGYPHPPPAQYQPVQYGGAGSFRAVPMPEKVVDVEETKPEETKAVQKSSSRIPRISERTEIEETAPLIQKEDSQMPPLEGSVEDIVEKISEISEKSSKPASSIRSSHSSLNAKFEASFHEAADENANTDTLPYDSKLKPEEVVVAEVKVEEATDEGIDEEFTEDVPAGQSTPSPLRPTALPRQARAVAVADSETESDTEETVVIEKALPEVKAAPPIIVTQPTQEDEIVIVNESMVQKERPEVESIQADDIEMKNSAEIKDKSELEEIKEPENTPVDNADEKTEDVPEDVLEEKPEEKREAKLEEKPEETPEEKPEEEPESEPEEKVDEEPEAKEDEQPSEEPVETTKVVAEVVPEDKPEDGPKQTPEVEPEIPSEDKPDTQSKDNQDDKSDDQSEENAPTEDIVEQVTEDLKVESEDNIEPEKEIKLEPTEDEVWDKAAAAATIAATSSSEPTEKIEKDLIVESEVVPKAIDEEKVPSSYAENQTIIADEIEPADKVETEDEFISATEATDASEDDADSEESDVEEKINKTIEEMKLQLENEKLANTSLTSKDDQTITDISEMSSMQDYASCETLDSVSTLQGDSDTPELKQRPVSMVSSTGIVFPETDAAMVETENLIKNSYEAAVQALGTTDEETETSEYEEIDSDLKLTTKLTPEPKPETKSDSDSERQQIRVEKELGKIASDIDKVADNLASSQENLINK